MAVSIKLEGIGEVDAALRQLEADFGIKESSRKVLVPAVREAMKPVLETAKSMAPKDTGDLARTLWLEARRPSRRDMRSKYIHTTDVVIASVTTKAFPKKLKKQFYAENQDLYKSDRDAYRKKFKQFAYSLGFPYDARAIAQEFGSAKISAQPFLRPALESQAQATVSRLSEILARRIAQFRSKQKTT